MNFPDDKVLWHQFTVAKDAVYFATADKKKQYFGFGVKDMVIAPTPEELKTWINKQQQPIFGGLPFDCQNVTNSKLMNGYFVAPEIVYEVNARQTWGARLQMSIANKVRTQQAKILNQTDDETWLKRVDQQIKIMQGDATKQKVVLGRQRKLTLTQAINEEQLLTQLIAQQPNSYHVIFKHDGEIFVSATPERLVQVEAGKFSTAGVAGTSPRGRDKVEDENLAKQLLHDHKNLLEHEYVVQTIKQRLQTIAKVNIPSQPKIMKNPQVQHLYTPITGKLTIAINIIDLVLRLHPTPALGGKPFDWAMATIQAIELQPRGLFAAPIGMVLPNGDGEFVVGIRSMLIQDTTAVLFAGAGILADSDANQEFNETGLKMTPMMNLFKGETNE